MRTARLLAAAVLATAVLVTAGAGCGAGPPSPSRPAPPSASTIPVELPTVTSSPAGDDRRGDLVRGVRTLRGVIERDGDWVILRTDGGRWALLGDRGKNLAAGREVRVLGTPAPPPAGCPADRALTVTG